MKKVLTVVPAALLSLAVAGSLTSCGDSASIPAPRPSANLETVEFHLDWAGPEYIGYYAAKAMGYYADRGFDAKLIAGAGSAAASERILEGSVPIGTVSATALVREIIARSGPGAELPETLPTIEAIIFPNSPSVILTRGRQRVTAPAGLAGMSLGYTTDVAEAYRQLKELLALHPGLEEQIEFRQDMLQAPRSFSRGATDGLVTYMMDAPPALELDGVDYNATLLSDLGYNAPSQCIILAPNHGLDADTIRDFLEASCEGWEYVRRNPENAAKLFDQLLSGHDARKTEIIAGHTVDFLPEARPADPHAPYTDREARARAIRSAVDVVLNAKGYPWSEAQRQNLVRRLVGPAASQELAAE